MPPLGPTNIAVMYEGIKKDIKSGTAIGAGAGFMDLFYIIAAFGGISLFDTLIPENARNFFIYYESSFESLITFIGCFIVIFSGIKIMKSKVAGLDDIKSGSYSDFEIKLEKKFGEYEHKIEEKNKEFVKLLNKEKIEKSNILSGFIKGVLFCLSSVTLPASWFAIVGYLKSYGIIDSRFVTGFMLSIGVFVGTTAWFYTLVKILSVNSHKLSPRNLSKLNTIVGIILILLGIFLFYKAIDFLL